MFWWEKSLIRQGGENKKSKITKIKTLQILSSTPLVITKPPTSTFIDSSVRPPPPTLYHNKTKTVNTSIQSFFPCHIPPGDRNAETEEDKYNTVKRSQTDSMSLVRGNKSKGNVYKGI
jgi:hypothetical protein